MNAGQHRKMLVSLRRWISAFLFLSVFFLPLHIHVATAATSHLSKECSCVHGSRTEAGLAIVISSWVRNSDFAFHQPFQRQFPSRFQLSFQAIRAPPVF